MKLREIINNLDKSKENSDWINLEEFANEFGINQYMSPPDDIRISAYYFLKWYCTDSYVGGRVYFLDDKPICISWQKGRKGDEKFSWISQESYEQTHKYILSLVEQDNKKTIDPIDLDEDWGPGYPVDFSSQLLTDTVFHIPTNTYVEVVKKYNDHSSEGIKDWRFVDVKFDDGKVEKIPMSDILVPYEVKKENELHN